MAEQQPVKLRVAGSIPASGANLTRHDGLVDLRILIKLSARFKSWMSDLPVAVQ